jgi:hypothetical protein
MQQNHSKVAKKHCSAQNLQKNTKTGQKSLKKDFREKKAARDAGAKKITHFWPENLKKVKNKILKKPKSVSKMQPK